MKLTRGVMGGISILAGIVLVAILSFVLPEISRKAAIIFLDRYSTVFTYPFTIQNLMIILFCLGIGDIVMRWRAILFEKKFMAKHYLPEDERTILQSHDLGGIRRNVRNDLHEDGAYLPAMIDRSILQFQASHSVEQTNMILNSVNEIYFNQMELKYNMLRYLSWVIPTIGFIGTVVGIAYALSAINPDQPNLENITKTLAIAFNTTLLALMLSAALVFLIHLAQEREEGALNSSHSYCLNNLINRLYVSD
ncbi:MAG: MotA/TolQ/ExbB proton channel family protein [Desulfarculaceae bacterium]|nr:MotA/TolQ/ExbB proton channel family protein [Desulfarculaceae bacterium]MCF8072132.1 MotA/TolQ/ExbB proton channel family protein [Desulfarculaceae bacterium]MCF8100053.1 MotA/TolQ/ExbB proton channel family protein [Desulfarculaceae bacterium]MCF8118260.1 MotA/TolQ/ExbB proton channel family protein [Desulfarculaceae bacterium]